jgi:hypothetical protein
MGVLGMRHGLDSARRVDHGTRHVPVALLTIEEDPVGEAIELLPPD